MPALTDIALDAMGSDDAPEPEIRGAILACLLFVAGTAVTHAKASGCIWAKHPAMTAADALVQDDAATTSLIAALQAARPDRVVLRDNDRRRAMYPSQSSRL